MSAITRIGGAFFGVTIGEPLERELIAPSVKVSIRLLSLLFIASPVYPFRST